MVARNGLLVGLFALAAWGQPSDKVFYFAHLDTPDAMQEVKNAVRSIADIHDAALDMKHRSLTVTGNADQIAMAGWLTAELDKSASVPGTRDLPFDDPRSPQAQIVFLGHVDTPQEMQQIVNAIRSSVDIQRCFPMNQQKAIVMRGTVEQVKAADWLLGILDQPAGAESSGSPRQYKFPAGDPDRIGAVLQVAAVAHVDTPQALQDITNVARGISDIQRLYPIFSRKCLVMRASEDQVAMVTWLLKELDGPGGQGTREFKAGSLVVNVAYVNAATPQSLQETVNQIRTETSMERVFSFNPQRAVAMRGTADQLAQAQQVIQSKAGR